MSTETPDLAALLRDHLVKILSAKAGQDDPLKPRLRDELAAIRAEIARRPDTTKGQQ
jgi:hypothetical protein